MLAITTLTSTDIPTDQQPDGPANECPKRDLDRALSRPESCLSTRKNVAQNPGRFRLSSPGAALLAIAGGVATAAGVGAIVTLGSGTGRLLTGYNDYLRDCT